MEINSDMITGMKACANMLHKLGETDLPIEFKAGVNLAKDLIASVAQSCEKEG